MPIETFNSPDGTRIACSVTGRGPALVLVHGTTADGGRWQPITTTLEQRFTVYAMDRRGRSASGDHPQYAIEREFEDVATVVDALPGPVALFGHSYGAICALEAATRVPQLGKLVLYEPPISTSGPVVDPGLVDRLDTLLATGDRDGLIATFLAEGPRLPAHEISRMRSLPAWQARVAAAHTVPRELRASIEYRFDAARFAVLRVPTLLLLGGASPAFFRTALELVKAALPHAQLDVLAGQQHNAIDAAPDLLLRELLAFL